MTRALAFLVHNWPLKLAAVVLASLLYGVFVLTQDTRQQTIAVPIEARNQPESVARLSNLGEVTRVRYVTSADIPVSSSSFIASVDLANATLGTSSAQVNLQAIDERISIIEFEPQRISVTLDEVISRTVPVEPEQGPIPPGLEIRTPEVSVDSVSVRGASSAVRQVERVVARIQIDSNGVNFDRDVELIPVDALGNEIPQITVTPAVAHVEVAVFSDRTTRTVPVAPVITGRPDPGFELARITVEPLLVTLEGDADELAFVLAADTEPLSMNGATSTIEQTVPLALPTGVLPVGVETVHVTITFRPLTGTRSFNAAVELDGERSGLTYALSDRSVLVAIGGSIADLDRLEGRQFTVEAAVGGLEPGEHSVPIAADLPAGLTLHSADPPRVTVTITAPSPSPEPLASPDPSASPAASP